tara:strand:- start:2816 stop:3718 length:903 start_codon:yes stop_codon:yes gene_type:complete
MFKKIFKAAKDLIRSPVGQLGIGLLLPGMAGMSGTLGGIGSFAAKNPALFQAGLGLLGGAKPQDVLRNVALSAGTSALRGGMSGQGGVGEFFGMQPRQIAPAIQNLQPTKFQGMQDQMSNLGRSTLPNLSLGNADNLVNQIKEDPGLLRRLGLIKDTVMDENGNVRNADFFEKYGNILRLGAIGSSVAAAALGEDQAQALYDPNQNPYLTGDTKITDSYTPIEYNKGGILDFPEKDGMINGPGNGQSDDIPAMLSDGEFVMTKQAVMAAGNGDRDQGTKKMYSMMNSLENKADSMGIGRM